MDRVIPDLWKIIFHTDREYINLHEGTYTFSICDWRGIFRYKKYLFAKDFGPMKIYLELIF